MVRNGMAVSLYPSHRKHLWSDTAYDNIYIYIPSCMCLLHGSGNGCVAESLLCCLAVIFTETTGKE